MRGDGGRSRARQNAMRSGVVVLGAVAFGYLSFRIGFKPYLDRAQEAMDSHNSSSSSSAAAAAAADASASGAAQPDQSGGDSAPSKDPAVVLRD